jgi:hypothetical protein
MQFRGEDIGRQVGAEAGPGRNVVGEPERRRSSLRLFMREPLAAPVSALQRSG